MTCFFFVKRECCLSAYILYMLMFRYCIFFKYYRYYVFSGIKKKLFIYQLRAGEDYFLITFLLTYILDPGCSSGSGCCWLERAESIFSMFHFMNRYRYTKPCNAEIDMMSYFSSPEVANSCFLLIISNWSEKFGSLCSKANIQDLKLWNSCLDPHQEDQALRAGRREEEEGPDDPVLELFQPTMDQKIITFTAVWN
jgi:hypothetical protein